MPKRNTPRETYVSRDVMAGCFDCHGSDAVWYGPNAQGLAARHHDATGHATWADVNMCVRYGKTEEIRVQGDKE
jgi:hypothetical protein